jgi:hypothetical protein
MDTKRFRERYYKWRVYRFDVTLPPKDLPSFFIENPYFTIKKGGGSDVSDLAVFRQQEESPSAPSSVSSMSATSDPVTPDRRPSVTIPPTPMKGQIKFVDDGNGGFVSPPLPVQLKIVFNRGRPAWRTETRFIKPRFIKPQPQPQPQPQPLRRSERLAAKPRVNYRGM